MRRFLRTFASAIETESARAPGGHERVPEADSSDGIGTGIQRHRKRLPTASDDGCRGNKEFNKNDQKEDFYNGRQLAAGQRVGKTAARREVEPPAPQKRRCQSGRNAKFDNKDCPFLLRVGRDS